MSHIEMFLWVAFPWLSIVAFVIGVFWRWRTDQFGWTTHSSQIYESRLLRLSSPLFHWGMMFVIIGHIMGLAIPKAFTRAVGVSDHAYHLIATIPGTIADIARSLHLSQGTVRNHVSSAMLKMDARTRAEAATLARSAGWL